MALVAENRHSTVHRFEQAQRFCATPRLSDFAFYAFAYAKSYGPRANVRRTNCTGRRRSRARRRGFTSEPRRQGLERVAMGARDHPFSRGTRRVSVFNAASTRRPILVARLARPRTMESAKTRIS
jgi:hypothetical protein